MNLPVFSQLAGNFRFSETGSLETASSTSESTRTRLPLWRTLVPNVSSIMPRPKDSYPSSKPPRPICLRPLVCQDHRGDGQPDPAELGLAVCLIECISPHRPLSRGSDTPATI